MRGTLALALALVGYSGVSRTLAYTLHSRQPEWAYALEPGDGRVSALLARKFSGAQATSADRARGDVLARRALLQDPTAVVAVSTLGLNTQLRGNASGARRLFAYAQRLSRRDLAAQLWAIEDAVARGDVNEALRHYDVALRTSYAAPDLLFPVLSAAIANPMVRAGAVRLLATRPGWGDSFLLYVAARGPDPRATASLLTDLHHLGLHVLPAATTELIKVLISAGFMDDAWRYYVAIHPDAERRSSRDPAFTADFVNPSPFDWVPVNEGGVTTSIQRGEHGGLFDFAAPASTGGPLLRQVQVLPPGSYRIEGHSSNIEQSTGSTPYWVLTCTDGRELGRVAIPASSQAKGRFVGQFDVPAECPAQMLTLIARPSDMVAGVNGQIDQVRLFPAP